VYIPDVFLAPLDAEQELGDHLLALLAGCHSDVVHAQKCLYCAVPVLGHAGSAHRLSSVDMVQKDRLADSSPIDWGAEASGDQLVVVQDRLAD
jgi:hypothetical protein